MTVRKRSKIGRYRGTRWHGKGSKKKRRGGGSRGGRGMAGTWNHRRLWLLKKFGPNYYAERNKRLKPEPHGEVMNLQGLEALALSAKDNKINLTELGYSKLLGAGKISTPVSIKVEKASKSAIEKIQKAGGSVELS